MSTKDEHKEKTNFSRYYEINCPLLVVMMFRHVTKERVNGYFKINFINSGTVTKKILDQLS